MSLNCLPPIVNTIEAYAPLLKLFDPVLVTAGTLAKHWGYTEEHLCNLRKAGRGPPFMKLGTGGIRYRQSEIIAAEVQHTLGPLTVERVCLAIAACETVSPKDRTAIQEHVRAAFAVKG